MQWWWQRWWLQQTYVSICMMTTTMISPSPTPAPAHKQWWWQWHCTFTCTCMMTMVMMIPVPAPSLPPSMCSNTQIDSHHYLSRSMIMTPPAYDDLPLLIIIECSRYEPYSTSKHHVILLSMIHFLSSYQIPMGVIPMTSWKKVCWGGCCSGPKGQKLW